jgi:hypothetical protein
LEDDEEEKLIGAIAVTEESKDQQNDSIIS